MGLIEDHKRIIQKLNDAYNIVFRAITDWTSLPDPDDKESYHKLEQEYFDLLSDIEWVSGNEGMN